MNRRFSRAKALLSHGVLHAGYHVCSSHGESRRVTVFFLRIVLVPNYLIIELVYFNTEHRGESRSFVTNYRIIESLFTRRVTESLGIYVTNYRIIEFLFTRRVTESLGIYVTNYRIVEFFFTRKITDGHGLIVPRLVLWTH